MPIKIIGLVLVVFGLIFRAISLAYFKQHAKTLPDDPKVRRRFEARKYRALIIDGAFVAMGFYLIIRP